MNLHHLADRFKSVRASSVEICARLEREDYVVQPCSEVSPPKWHLAHTTWFFEEMILRSFAENYRSPNDLFRMLFNSYYKAAGAHWLQSERGQLSRPTVDEVLAYRRHVDEHMMRLLDHSEQSAATLAEVSALVELGLHHEQQHQELLLMDIKYILGVNPGLPAYESMPLPIAREPSRQWSEYAGGVYETGCEGVSGFSFDNERPRHKSYLNSFRIAEAVVTNGQFREFIQDKGYEQPALWLSQGWDWIKKNRITKPLYWMERDGNWFEYTLHGSVNLDLNAPVMHLSYFEADAFATWSGCRLPTEAENELFLTTGAGTDSPPAAGIFHALDPNAQQGQVWTWTSSHYSPYPGFRPFSGLAAEYNGKFMCGQFVLRGGCFATPAGHLRPSYRNFYLPGQRWMFSGVRLAKDL